jgi:hypothetical protein
MVKTSIDTRFGLDLGGTQQSSRLSSHKKLLIEEGGFAETAVIDAFRYDSDSMTKELIAKWLRGKWAELRAAKQLGNSPLRVRGKILETDIKDIAMTLLECSANAPLDELICLLRELLELDKHREARADAAARFQWFVGIEAWQILQGKDHGVREMARLTGISKSGISDMRKRSDYADTLAESKKATVIFIQRAVREILTADNPTVSEEEILEAVTTVNEETARRVFEIKFAQPFAALQDLDQATDGPPVDTP